HSQTTTRATATLDLHDALPIFTPDLDKNDGNVGLAGFTVTYKANDGSLDSNTATLTISVSAVNDAPVAADDAASTAEDTAVAKDVVANDTDVDNADTAHHVNAVTLSATNATATLDVDGRTIHFTPDLDKNDGNVGLAGFTVTRKLHAVPPRRSSDLLTISVSAVNDAPVAADDAASTAEDTAVAKDVVANDTDVD